MEAAPARSRALLIVADYPFAIVGNRVYSSIAWDGALADLYTPAFSRILLLGRLRRLADRPPPAWVPVDLDRFEVLDAGNWERLSQFLRNLPRVWGAVDSVWDRVAVVYLKLFYLNSLAVWAYNRVRPRRRKPVVTLLVGDSAAALETRQDLIRARWIRRLGAWVVRRIIQHVQRRAATAGFVGSYLAEKYGPSSGTTVVANESWVRPHHLRRHDRAEPRRPSTLLFVGRLVALKRVDAVLRAADLLRQAGTEVRVRVIGEGPDRSRLEELVADLALDDRVHFDGWLSPLSTALWDAYDAADVLCLPSMTEGVPLVVVEAMARGVAIVASDVGGVGSLVHDGTSGFLIPPGDASALAEAVGRLVQVPGLWRGCVEGGFGVAERNTFDVQRRRLADATAELIP